MNDALITADVPESLPESTLRELCSAGAVRDIAIVGVQGGGFIVRVAYGSASPHSKVLGTSRGSIRRFGSLDTAALFVRELGIDQFRVDMTDYEPGRVRAARPDRSEALKKTRTNPRQESLLL